MNKIKDKMKSFINKIDTIDRKYENPVLIFKYWLYDIWNFCRSLIPEIQLYFIEILLVLGAIILVVAIIFSPCVQKGICDGSAPMVLFMPIR